MMQAAERNELIDRVTGLGESAIAGTDIEIAEVQMRGGGKARLLRVYIDKPGGVTHADCEFVSERLGKLLDDQDVIPGDSYTLEISSPGVERSLSKPRDFERVTGRKIRVLLKQPIQGQTRFEGRVVQTSDETFELELAPDELLRIPFQQLEKAKLKFEW